MKMREPSKKPWSPLTARCCSAKNRTIFGCRPSKSEMSKNVAPVASFRSISDLSRSSSMRMTHEELVQSFGPDLYDFQLSELQGITHNFSSHFLLGKGGFGPVHKGYVDDNLRHGLKAQPVAVKLLDMESHQGHREWLAEVIFLGQLRHHNLVKLIGYCCENEDRLLVYEFMPRGSLENHLFKRLSISLPWETRLKIAIGAAKGLAFLHGAQKPPVIYRDFKTSNVLLDSDFTAKLSDFGLAKMGPEGSKSHVTTRVMGTQGYAAPEYVSTGHLTTKSDVYSFGVVLLELLTGRRAVDKMRPKSERNLVDWARPYLTSSRRLRCIMDPRMGGHYSIKGAKEVALLTLRCISENPKDRPKMGNVIDTLEGVKNFKDMALISAGQRPPSAANSKPVNKVLVNGVSSKGFARAPLTIPTKKTCMPRRNIAPA